MQSFFEDLTEVLWSIFDAASSAFALAVYIFIAGAAIYAIGTVIYNIVLAHRRRPPQHWEPPTAKRGPTIYPDGREEVKP